MKPMIKRGIAAAMLTSSAIGFYLSPGYDFVRLGFKYANPVSITEFRVKYLPLADYETAFREAISEKDYDTANAIADLAAEHGKPLQAELIEQANLSGFDKSLANAFDFSTGFVTGATETVPQITGSVVSDLVGFGDLRDVLVQGKKLATKEDVDWIILSFAVLGIGTSVANISAIAAPLDMGVSAIKTVNKTGKLTNNLRRQLTTAARNAVDTDALSKAVTSSGALLKPPSASAFRKLFDAIPSFSTSGMDFSKFRKEAKALVPIDTAAAKKLFAPVIRPAAKNELTSFAESAATISYKGGYRAGMKALELSDNSADLNKFKRISNHYGKKTMAIMKTVGKKSIQIGALIYGILASFLAVVLFIIGCIWTIISSVMMVRTFKTKS